MIFLVKSLVPSLYAQSCRTNDGILSICWKVRINSFLEFECSTLTSLARAWLQFPALVLIVAFFWFWLFSGSSSCPMLWSSLDFILFYVVLAYAGMMGSSQSVSFSSCTFRLLICWLPFPDSGMHFFCIVCLDFDICLLYFASRLVTEQKKDEVANVIILPICVGFADRYHFGLSGLSTIIQNQ